MTEHTLRYLDVALPGGAVMRIGLATGGPPDDDDGGELIIAAGFPDRVGWSRLLAGGVNVPASALPELRDALAELEASR